MNQFLYALGIGALAWLLFTFLGSLLYSLSNLMASLANWYRYSATPYAWEMGVAAGAIYLLIVAVTNSRR
jgi:hypothetical protein